jgi:head-tail adaptor
VNVPPPDLRRFLMLEAPDGAPDGGGGRGPGWRAVCPVWAELRPVGATERAAGGTRLAAVSHRATLRATGVDGPAPGRRLRDATRVYAIRSVAQADPRGVYVTCWLEELAPA